MIYACAGSVANWSKWVQISDVLRQTFPAIAFLPLFLLCSSLAQEEKEQKDVPAEKETKDPTVLFRSDSESARFKTIAGSWRFFDYEGKKIIRLTPEPIRQCRVEMGSLLQTYDVSISAKLLAREKGRLKPRMGVGLFSEQGYFLRLSPGRKKLELVQYGEIIAEKPIKWVSAQWTYIELKMKAAQNHWVLEGRAWPENQTRPAKATLVHKAYPTSLTHPLSGRASLTGSPYNGLPIFFDEVVLKKEG